MDNITLNLDGFDLEFGVDTETYQQALQDETDDWANVHILVTSNLLNLTMRYEINSDILTFKEIEELSKWLDDLEDPNTPDNIGFIYPEIEFEAMRIFNNSIPQTRLKVEMHFNFFYPSENSWPDHYLSLSLYENDIKQFNTYLKYALNEHHKSKATNM